MTWPTARLGEVAEIERAGVDPSDLPGNTRYLGLEHIERGGRIIGSQSIYEAAISSTKFRFDQRHVLFGKLRPNLGKVARPTFMGVCSTDILPILPGRRLDRDYIAHFLSQPSIVDYAARLATGANLPRLSPSALAQFEVPLPAIEEQRRIAAILDQADVLRAKRRQALARLEDLTQSIFEEMFIRVETMVTFGDVIADGPTNGLYRPASDYGSGTPILRIDGFDGGVLKSQVWKRLRTTQAETKRYCLAEGDIVINRVNALSHLGKSALIEGISEPSVYESNMMRLRLDTSKVNSRFVIAWLQTRKVKQQILRKAKKAINQASINQTDVRSLQMPLPGGSEQQLFARRVDEAHVRKAVLQQADARTDELISSLQSRAFAGQL